MSGTLSKKAKKQIINIAVLVALVGITLTVLIVSNRELNFTNIRNFLANSRWWLIAAACGCMVLAILCEGWSLHVIARRLGHKSRIVSSVAYSAADAYYSSITPSASGGQPASAFYMMRDGMSGGTAGFTLVFNSIAYTAAILILGGAAFIVRPEMYELFDGGFTRFLVVAGFVTQGLLLGLFIACMFCHRVVQKCGNGIVLLFTRMKIVKHPDKWREKIAAGVDKYHSGLGVIRKNPFLFFEALVFNVCQRLAKTLIPCLVCLAADSSAGFVDLLAMQTFVTVGYNFIPLPGGVGAYEYLYLNVYNLYFDKAFLLSALMVSRVISYYLYMVFSGAITLSYHIHGMRAKSEENASDCYVTAESAQTDKREERENDPIGQDEREQDEMLAEREEETTENALPNEREETWQSEGSEVRENELPTERAEEQRESDLSENEGKESGAEPNGVDGTEDKEKEIAEYEQHK
ncbi:MAG: flippase-like domain-containing protein [Clostridia bacterium]|nr:flippase-like domain-containing protein [Clostridia bacterium]